jgi:hypothetical protein
MGFMITGYVPSHRQHRLPESLTVEQITIATKSEPKLGSTDGKCDHTWTFYAQENFADVPIVCQIWDYKGSRWSAFGPREVFESIGLLPKTDD